MIFTLKSNREDQNTREERGRRAGARRRQDQFPRLRLLQRLHRHCVEDNQQRIFLAGRPKPVELCLPIRLLPTPTKCGMHPFPGVQPVKGRRGCASRLLWPGSSGPAHRQPGDRERTRRRRLDRCRQSCSPEPDSADFRLAKPHAAQSLTDRRLRRIAVQNNVLST